MDKPNNWRRLASQICIEAVRDLRSTDPVVAVDSLAWFLDGQAELMLADLDLFPHGDVLEMAVSYEV